MVISAPDQLSCENHPFFEWLHALWNNVQTLYNRILSTVGNIFETCTMTRPTIRKVILSGLWNVAFVLERKATSQIL